MIIDWRFRGPAESGNGGYTAGVIASGMSAGGDAVQVTLRRPPPLDTPLRLATGGQVYAGEQLIAEAAAAEPEPDDDPIPPVSYQEAVRAAAGYAGFQQHPFPECYVCGPRRAEGDGLRIFPGQLAGSRGTAAPWQVPDEVTTPTVWAALDCPGGWAIIGPGRPYVLGRIMARISVLPAPGTACVAVGAVAGTEGRKAQVRTALYGEEGDLLAQAYATWVAV